MLLVALDKALLSETVQRRDLERGHHGFKHAVEWVSKTPDVAKEQVQLRMEWGGRNPLPWLESTGAHAPAVMSLLRGMQWQHRVSRVDSALDLQGPGTFDQLVRLGQQVIDGSKTRGVQIKSETLGDWLYAEHGRTLRLGSTKAAALVRIYEKGHEQRAKGVADAPLDWVRVELQYRPEKRHDKGLAAVLTTDAVWGVREWTRDLWARLNAGELLDKVKHQAPPPSTLGRRAAALAKQYGPTLADLDADMGSEALHAWIDEQVEQVRRDRLRRERER